MDACVGGLITDFDLHINFMSPALQNNGDLIGSVSMDMHGHVDVASKF